MRIGGHDIAVCSWSLRVPDTKQLIDCMREVGIEHVQLALGRFVDMDDAQREREIDQLCAAGITITAGMIGFQGEDYSTIAMIRKTGGYVPDALWPQRKQLTLQAGKIAQAMGLKRISTHIGFVPPSSDPAYKTMVTRLGEITSALGSMGVDLLMETGQEPASELLQFINDLAPQKVYVNFDPANMILYGAGDPIDAIGMLARQIAHVHVKDAKLSKQPGTIWGEEVAFGTGQVDPGRFLGTLNEVGFTGPLAIEREAGPNRMDDIRLAITALKQAAGE